MTEQEIRKQVDEELGLYLEYGEEWEFGDFSYGSLTVKILTSGKDFHIDFIEHPERENEVAIHVVDDTFVECSEIYSYLFYDLIGSLINNAIF